MARSSVQEDRKARAARLREEQAQAERAARRRSTLVVGGVFGLVLLIIVGLVVLKLTQKAPAAATASGAASASVVSAVTSVPSSTFDAVGAPSTLSPVITYHPTAKPLTADGKPRILYYGAEFCPYCAAERWSVAVALSRFGTWSNLGQTTSSSSDVYPSTSTLSFHGAGYSSQYVSFTGYETTTNQPDPAGGYVPLDTPSKSDLAVVDQYDAPPYVPSGDSGSIPFMDMGGTYLLHGPQYSPQVLAGLSHEQIAADLKNPSSPVTQAIVGSANVLTATICKLTHDAPASVCSSAGVQAASSHVPS